MELLLRPAEESDGEDIARLLDQLGYPCSVEDVIGRIRHLASSPADRILVASAAGETIAFASLHILPYFQSGETVCRLSALVTEERHRGSGVGTRLLAAVEQFAREQGCDAVELTSNERRLEAHAFYERRAYQRHGIKFYKRI